MGANAAHHRAPMRSAFSHGVRQRVAFPIAIVSRHDLVELGGLVEETVMGSDAVITGIGLVLAGCRDRGTFWDHVVSGRSQLQLETGATGRKRAVGRVNRFEPVRVAAEVPPHVSRRWGRDVTLYVESLLAARDDAALSLPDEDRERIGLFDGTSRGPYALFAGAAAEDRTSLSAMPGMAVGYAAALLGVQGPTCTLHGTCASGALAAGEGLREIERGELDVAFVTGHDAALIERLFAWYESAGLLSPEQDDARRAVRPYGGDTGNAFGEGAVTLVLEERGHAERRGAPILATLAGHAAGNAGAHPTAIDPEGRRPARMIARLLERTGIGVDRIDFVIGHGNGVAQSDRSELAYMRRVFGPRTSEVALLSTKPLYGHTLGASAMVSLAAAALMVHERTIAPAVNVDPERLPPDFRRQPGATRLDRPPVGLVTTYGMGGQNAALVVRG
jgi:3-oxoacyl-[acyl-carrier-protein] synthase II